MKIGVIGTGNVGFALANGFIKYGHDVKLGTRDISQEKVQNWKNEHGPVARVGSPEEAAKYGEIIVLALPWTGAKNGIDLAGVENLNGKIVIDPTNPLDFSGEVPVLSVGQSDSAGETVQRWLPDSMVVKTFNHVGAAHMVDPDFPDGPPDMFYCGNDQNAKSKVAQILKQFGWNSIDLGNIEYSRYLEPLAMIWIVYGSNTQTYNHAFKLLRK